MARVEVKSGLKVDWLMFRVVFNENRRGYMEEVQTRAVFIARARDRNRSQGMDSKSDQEDIRYQRGVVRQ